MPYEYMQPSNIRFIHDTIHPLFRNGKSVNGTIDKILKRQISMEDILPTIEVVKFNNQVYSLNNRRLYVFRVLQYEGRLREVKVSVVDISYLSLEKCTTENYGSSIKVRRDTTRNHTKAASIQNGSSLARDLEEYYRSPSPKKTYTSPVIIPVEEKRDLEEYRSPSPKITYIAPVIITVEEKSEFSEYKSPSFKETYTEPAIQPIEKKRSEPVVIQMPRPEPRHSRRERTKPPPSFCDSFCNIL